MPRIAAGIITYPIHPKRLEYLEYCIQKFQEHVTASRDDLVAFVCCESDPRGDVHSVGELCSKYGLLFYVNQGPPCMGSNQNTATTLAFTSLHCDCILLLIDDSFALGPIDLSDHRDFLKRNAAVDILRFHWSDRDGARPTFTDRGDGYNQVNPSSHYFYDDSPHMRRPNYFDRFGKHLELNPGKAGAVEYQTNAVMRKRGANIVATKERLFGKSGGEVSACHG